MAIIAVSRKGQPFPTHQPARRPHVQADKVVQSALSKINLIKMFLVFHITIANAGIELPPPCDLLILLSIHLHRITNARPKVDEVLSQSALTDRPIVHHPCRAAHNSTVAQSQSANI